MLLWALHVNDLALGKCSIWSLLFERARIFALLRWKTVDMGGTIQLLFIDCNVSLFTKPILVVVNCESLFALNQY